MDQEKLNSKYKTMTLEEAKDYYREHGFRIVNDYIPKEEIDNLSVEYLVKTQRERYGMSQRKMAEIMLVDNSTITRLENGDIKKPSVLLCRKLSIVTGIDTGDWMRLSGYAEGDIEFLEDRDPDWLPIEEGNVHLRLQNEELFIMKKIILHELLDIDKFKATDFYNDQNAETKEVLIKLLDNMIKDNDKHYNISNERIQSLKRLSIGLEGQDEKLYDIYFRNK